MPAPSSPVPLAHQALRTTSCQDDTKSRNLGRGAARVLVIATSTDVYEAARAALRSGLWTWRAVRTERHGKRRALLIDLDGIGVPINRLDGELERLLRHVGPCRLMFAAGHPTLSHRARRSCLRLGIEVLGAKTKPDSADRALIRAGRRLHRDGVTELVVVGRDGAFADLPGRLRVIVIGEEPPISQRLRHRADAVEVLPRLSARQARREGRSARR